MSGVGGGGGGIRQVLTECVVNIGVWVCECHKEGTRLCTY